MDSIESLEREAGHVIAVSGWLQIDQDRIDDFADATGDRQWIRRHEAHARGPMAGRSRTAI